jgi:hypothetical protein
VFAVAQMRDLRFALDLYRRERGTYPTSLDELVEARWVGSDQVRISGYQLQYHRIQGGRDYRLDLTTDR